MSRAHGTNARYHVDNCRCEPCRDAANAYARDLRRRKAYGVLPYVDAEPARRHLNWLRDEGMGLKTIAKASGVAHGSLAKLLYGDAARGMQPSKRIRPETAAAILATPPILADGCPVDPRETIERLRALVAIGWPQRNLAKALGVAESHFHKVIHGHRGIGAGFERRAANLYDALGMIPGPSARSRAIGRANGWSGLAKDVAA